MYKYILLSYTPYEDHYCGRGCNCLQSTTQGRDRWSRHETIESLVEAMVDFDMETAEYAPYRGNSDNVNTDPSYHHVLTTNSFINEDDDEWDDINDSEHYISHYLESNSYPDDVAELYDKLGKERMAEFAKIEKHKLEEKKKREAEERKAFEKKARKQKYEELKKEFEK